MPIDPHAFWSDNFYQHPALTNAVIAQAEAILEVRLPVELITLLRIQNGGYTRGFAHPMTRPTTWAEDHVPLDALAGIVMDTETPRNLAQNLLATEYMTNEWGLPPKQVLLSGDGHYWITLDYRVGPVPSVAWLDIDCGEDFQVAGSFRAFLDGLVPSATYDRV